ncbi:ABC transporter ATP-binding protein [Derxia gummosa]|uniref:ABC transporter ATP-binding protein n=1 Tax=Derxia gummosa DSM 723 TaxID=1121388 RepID=A0A8B6XBU7_9BURK|nr:ABC transporter ATP-binding protein [Derxia gummosa]
MSATPSIAAAPADRAGPRLPAASADATARPANATEADPIARLRRVSRTYGTGAAAVHALRGIDLDLPRGAFSVIAGPSGSGKSTLLQIAGALDRPDAGGGVEIDGVALDALDDDARADFRARRLGFVFQNFNLLPVLTALENVEYPMQLGAGDARSRRERARELLAAVGLAGKEGRRPGELSGGQRQRVAIARALANSPALVLADEPTANLDRATGAAIIELMRDMQRRLGTSFVFSSHDAQLMGHADVLVLLEDGRVTAPDPRATPAAGARA